MPPHAPLQVHSAGQLLTRDFVSMLPFTDELVVLELSGGAVLTALETGVGSFPALEGRFLQVGGWAGCSAVCVLWVCWRVLWYTRGFAVACAVGRHQMHNGPACLPASPPSPAVPTPLPLVPARFLSPSLPASTLPLPCPVQVSGIRFEFDPSRPAGSRIVPGSVEVAGEPVEMDRLYKASSVLYCSVLLCTAMSCSVLPCHVLLLPAPAALVSAAAASPPRAAPPNLLPLSLLPLSLLPLPPLLLACLLAAAGGHQGLPAGRQGWV